MRFSSISKIVKNEGEMTEELTTRRWRALLSTISRDDLAEDKLENKRFVIGILCLGRLPNAGINLMLTGSRHYISVTQRNCSKLILNLMRTELSDERSNKKISNKKYQKRSRT